ncbi:MAG: response regulator [Bauldia sp.]
MSALQKKLLDVFEIEYREHLEAIRQMLAKADGAEEGRPGFDLAEATRRAHSLKGAARAVGLEQVETLAHQLESVFIAVEKGESQLDRDVRQFIVDSLDEIEDGVVATRNAEPAGKAPKADDGSGPPPAMSQAAGAEAQSSFVRVGAENLDRLLKSAGELHADMQFQNLGSLEVNRLAQQMAGLESRWSHVWKQVDTALRRDAGSDLSGVLNGGEHLTSEIKGLAKGLRSAAQRQSKGARLLHHHLDDLERRVRSARMMPAESVFGSFRKMVRDLADSEGKLVEVTIAGLDCQADRLVLQRIKDPVMHMLRNAVSHGIEMPDERARRGKQPKGRIGLGVSNEHDRLKLVIEDDGRGIDFRRVAEKAVEQNRLSREDAEAASDEALVHLVFEPGFSTADSVTKISGRGVGLSVARQAVTGLQGTFDIRSSAKIGTRIALSLPVSVLSRRLLLVSFKGQIYALPAESVAKVMRVTADGMVTVEGRPAVRLSDSTLPLVSIGELLGSDDPVVATDTPSVCVVVVRSGAQAGVATHVGVAVEGFVGVNDFVVRNFETGGGEGRLWSGIISTEDGAPGLVLNTGAFVKREFGAANVVFRTERRESNRAKVVLVVDDSITTRTLEKSILEAHGYEVRLSVDGRDALDALRSDPPNIVVSDIEMPHVDGFELVQAMKGDKALSAIPIILVTSRADDRDREKGLQLGADAYVVKQKFDQNELLRTIKQIV